MSDRKLLELAAKAAGMESMRYASPYTGMSKMLDPARPETTGSIGPNWNPITDDGDALRLAVKLRMSVFHSLSDVYVVDDDGDIEVEEGHKRDPLAATRRAIVRVAAEIGRQMP